MRRRCAVCDRALDWGNACSECHRCFECCECESNDIELFDADELGLDPEEDDERY